jgi:NAD(P)-dependent dehydrogenase (short-subunit alcohol dehydrogenase family)
MPAHQPVVSRDGLPRSASTRLGRVGEPQDLLGTLAFLLSDDSAFVTGQTLLVNGGRLFA